MRKWALMERRKGPQLTIEAAREEEIHRTEHDTQRNRTSLEIKSNVTNTKLLTQCQTITTDGAC